MNHFEIISLEYHPNIQYHYQNFSELPGFVLLESVERIHGRFDILSAFPYDRAIVTHENFNERNVLKELADIFSNEASLIGLPFQGGAIGYISYDYGAKLAGIDVTPLAAMRNIPLLDLGFYDWAIIVDHSLKKVDLFAAHRHTDTTQVIKEVLDIWKRVPVENKEYKASSIFQSLISKVEYEQAFGTIHQDLRRGRCYQVNYTQPYYSSYEGETWELYTQVKNRNPMPFSAFLKSSDADILCFSPERFLLYDQGKVLTSPIKGTIKRSDIPKDDEELKKNLITSEKNRAENVMIVDLLRNDLGKIAKAGSIKVDNLCGIQSFQSVHHLVSDIYAECRDGVSPIDVLMACFPGGSITGAPKLEAMKLINEQEKYSRGIYCGSIGYFSHHGRFDTNIAIRTLIAKDNLLHLAAGGGIVIDSNCEDEYLECFTKIAAIINGLT